MSSEASAQSRYSGGLLLYSFLQQVVGPSSFIPDSGSGPKALAWMLSIHCNGPSWLWTMSCQEQAPLWRGPSALQEATP